MPKIHLVIGPVGAGKSTVVRRLCTEHGAVRLVLDEWMATLYGADERPAEGRIEWYIERTERCTALIWALTRDLMSTGSSVVLEIGLIQRAARESFYSKIDEMAFAYQVYLVDADRDVRRQRVMQRNRERGETYSMEVPLAVFERASDLWEAPDELERADREIQTLAG